MSLKAPGGILQTPALLQPRPSLPPVSCGAVPRAVPQRQQQLEGPSYVASALRQMCLAAAVFVPLSGMSRSRPSRQTGLRRIGRSGWHMMHSGAGVQISDDGLYAKRVNFRKPEGKCVVVSDTPMARTETETGISQYAEIVIDSENDEWNYGIDIGVTAQSPNAIGSANPDSLSWEELEDTWVITSTGQLRIRGRAYPRGAIPGVMMDSYDGKSLEWKDRLGIQVERTRVSMFINGKPAGSLDMKEVGEMPVEQDLYLVADVIGRACEIVWTDTASPKE
eukprot:TRINITY_DN44141_c0_g1_i1.p1 TRINITY_DN44141_c0_g1~~TRINITY_DN44141_c0_g1_i1.p1  ORF type:complete len:279 (+),score=37.73 TRINITY_DN44141_c0_g1_i1:76-912(+)